MTMPQATPSSRSPARRTVPVSAAVVLPAVLAALLAAGCGAEDTTHEITEVHERAEAGPANPPSTLEDRFGLRDRGVNPHGGDAHGAMGPARGPAWAWTTPEGWKELPPSQFREVGWEVADDTEVSFSKAGGGLAANVARWRKQMGLEPLDDAAIDALPRDRTMLGGPALRVEILGRYGGMRGEKDIADAKMLGLIAPLPEGGMAFLKMTGPTAVVEAEAERFYALGASIRRTASPAATASATAGPSAEPDAPEGAKPPFQWTVPDTWTEAPAKPPRLATFVPEGTTRTEAYVTVLPGKAGGARPNIDLWRSQVGLQPFTKEEFEALPRKSILGGTAIFCTLEGTRNETTFLLLGMILERPDQSVFVKMTGPAEEVRPEQERFRAFCESFRE